MATCPTSAPSSPATRRGRRDLHRHDPVPARRHPDLLVRDCSGANGSRERAMTERRDRQLWWPSSPGGPRRRRRRRRVSGDRYAARRPHRGHELSGAAAASGWSSLYLPLSMILLVLAVSVLLDGADRHQTRRPASRSRDGTARSGPGIRPSSTSRSSCSRPTIRCGCGTRCSSPCAPPSCRSSPACSRLTRSCGCATRAPNGSAAPSSSPIWCRPRSCSSRSPRSCSSTACSTRRSP